MSDGPGRKTIMTNEVLNKLKQAFAFGATDEEACLYAEISPATLYNYQEKDAEFLEQKHLLKKRPILLARQELIKGLEGNPELALKYLERKLRNEFGLRTEVTGADGVPLDTGVEELKDIANTLKKAIDGNSTSNSESIS